jgi:Nif-specific regulatory protein
MITQSFSRQQLELLTNIARHVADAEDVSNALRTVLEWLATNQGFERGVITLMSEDGSEVQADITVAEIPQSQSDKMRYQPGEGITGEVFATGNPVYLAQLDQADRFLDRAGLRRKLDQSTLAFFCVPVMYQQNIIGTLSVDKQTRAIEDPEIDQNFLLEVAHLIAPFVHRRRLEDKMEFYQHVHDVGGSFGKLVGKCAAILEVRRLVTRVGDASTTILCTGETGTGKGIIAQLIHESGPRRSQPFVEINCGAIPEQLIESELFGHEKGAFTGASQRRQGVIERAKGGTVFLDEIGELPLPAQTRLLRVLQTREFERVGGTQTLKCNARIVAATNRDLQEEVENGLFRADLFYRVNVFPIHIPPLRERGKADILLIAEHFIQQFSKDQTKQIERLDTPAIDMLTNYHWPGNVRELENVIERAVLLADGVVIHGHHLPPSLQMNKYTTTVEAHGNFKQLVENYETELITEALKDCHGNQTKAAEKLGLTKRIIQYKIRNYQIDYKRFK